MYAYKSLKTVKIFISVFCRIFFVHICVSTLNEKFLSRFLRHEVFFPKSISYHGRSQSEHKQLAT